MGQGIGGQEESCTLLRNLDFIQFALRMIICETEIHHYSNNFALHDPEKVAKHLF
jgi:hypothetical protein